MRTYTIQEPTVVANNNSTTCKGFQAFFEGSQCVHVNIIGRFVKE